MRELCERLIWAERLASEGLRRFQVPRTESLRERLSDLICGAMVAALPGMTYTATITSASLRLRESRIIAGLLLDEAGADAWKHTIFEVNALQMRSVESIKRICGLLRARLEPMGPGLWQLVRDGDQEPATQAVFAAAVKHSRLLGDFMDITMREQKTLFAERLESRMWTDYIEGCRGRDPDMPHWSDATFARLRSAVFSMLAQAGYLKDTRSMLLQNVFLYPQLTTYLRERGETYVLRCLEVAE